MVPVIPPRQNCKQLILYDPEPDQLRENVERFFKKLKTVPSGWDPLRQMEPDILSFHPCGRAMDHDRIIRQHNLI
jgi:hypothetical protein